MRAPSSSKKMHLGGASAVQCVFQESMIIISCDMRTILFGKARNEIRLIKIIYIKEVMTFAEHLLS